MQESRARYEIQFRTNILDALLLSILLTSREEDSLVRHHDKSLLGEEIYNILMKLIHYPPPPVCQINSNI